MSSNTATIADAYTAPGLGLKISVRGRAVIAWIKTSDGGTTTAHVFRAPNPGFTDARLSSTEAEFLGSATWFDEVDRLVKRANEE